jgi:hypothetical protein
LYRVLVSEARYTITRNSARRSFCAAPKKYELRKSFFHNAPSLAFCLYETQNFQHLSFCLYCRIFGLHRSRTKDLRSWASTTPSESGILIFRAPRHITRANRSHFIKFKNSPFAKIYGAYALGKANNVYDYGVNCLTPEEQLPFVCHIGGKIAEMAGNAGSVGLSILNWNSKQGLIREKRSTFVRHVRSPPDRAKVQRITAENHLRGELLPCGAGFD